MSDDAASAQDGPTAGAWLRRGDRTVCRSVGQLTSLWPGARFESSAQEFYADALRLRFEHIQVESILNSAYTCTRDRALIDQFPRPAFAIETVLEGQIRRQQQGLQYLQSAGTAAITVLDEPFTFTWRGPGRSVRTVVNLTSLDTRLRRPDAIRAGLLRPTPLVISYVGFVRSLVMVAEPDAAEHRNLEAALFRLHEAVLLEALQVPEPAGSLKGRIEDYIQVHLTDPELSPPSIAAALQVSLRSVHKAFNVDGATIAAEVRRQRVLAATALLHTSDGHTPLWIIARRVGFTSLDRLRTSFIAVLGINATDYQARLRAGHRNPSQNSRSAE